MENNSDINIIPCEYIYVKVRYRWLELNSFLSIYLILS